MSDKTKPQPEVPKKCPKCKSRDIDTELEDSDGGELDADLARAHGFDPDEDYDELFHEHMEFWRMQSEAECFRCGHRWNYGPWYYWDEEHLCFDAPRPLTPKEIAHAELIHQEEMGQQRLPGLE